MSATSRYLPRARTRAFCSARLRKDSDGPIALERLSAEGRLTEKCPVNAICLYSLDQFWTTPFTRRAYIKGLGIPIIRRTAPTRARLCTRSCAVAGFDVARAASVGRRALAKALLENSGGSSFGKKPLLKMSSKPGTRMVHQAGIGEVASKRRFVESAPDCIRVRDQCVKPAALRSVCVDRADPPLGRFLLDILARVESFGLEDYMEPVLEADYEIRHVIMRLAVL